MRKTLTLEFFLNVSRTDSTFVYSKRYFSLEIHFYLFNNKFVISSDWNIAMSRIFHWIFCFGSSTNRRMKQCWTVVSMPNEVLTHFMNDSLHMPISEFIRSLETSRNNLLRNENAQHTDTNDVTYVYFQFHFKLIHTFNSNSNFKSFGDLIYYFDRLCSWSFLVASFDFCLYTSAIAMYSWLRSSYCLIFLVRCSARLFDEAVFPPQHGPFWTKE